jgi:hypothetical protein
MTDDKIKSLAYNLIENKTTTMGLDISDEQLAWYVKGIVDLQSEIESRQQKCKYVDSQASKLVSQSEW